MLLRSAAIYIAVLFLPAALAASIWPPLREWESRLVKVLFVLIAMKPVIITVLALAGHAAAAAITGEARGDVGVMLSAIVIFALAACVPWALVTLVSMSADGAWSARAAHHGAREGISSGASRVGGSLSNARTAGSRMHGLPGNRGGSGSGGGETGGRGAGGGGPRETGGPRSSAGGGGPAGGGGGGGRGGGRGWQGAAAGAGGADAKATGPVGTVAAAAGMTYAAGKGTGQRAGQTADQAGGGSTPPSSRNGERGRGRGESASSGGASRAPGGRTGSTPSGNGRDGGGSSRPPAPRSGQRPGGGGPPTPPARSSGPA